MLFGISLVVVFILSVVLHEVSHGYMAYFLGDSTAKNEGRLTLNPIPHISMFGTIIIPGILLLFQTPFLFGWAKPVPYNPYNLRGRYGEALVAIAGPLTNILIALVCTAVFRLISESIPGEIAKFLFMVVLFNLFLAFLNMLPIPPLDGYKVLSAILPFKYRARIETLFSPMYAGGAVFMIFVLLFIVYFLSGYLASGVGAVATLLLYA